MAKIVPMTVKIADLPEVTEAFERAAQEIERLRREVDEWEERYDELLSSVGGVSPG